MMANKVNIGFTGDFSFSGYFVGTHTKEDLIQKEIFDFLNGNDANVINFESPITPCRMTKKKRLAHRCPPQVLDFVQNKFNNPILSLANNHMMDFDRIGMIDTLDALRSKNIEYIGAGENVAEASDYKIIGDDIKVGVFAIQYKNYKIAGAKFAGPMHDVRKKYIQATINELKQKVDYVVLVYHGGDEFLHAPMPYFRKRLKKYLNMGCDVIVAHHPHVVQGYEKFGKKTIFYSLGNFMFDTNYQRMQEDSDRGILLNISFGKDGYEFKDLPIRIDRENTRVVTADKDEYFVDFATLSYSRLWATEAARKEDSLARARELRLRDAEQAEIEKQENEARLAQLMSKYLDDGGVMDETDVDDETEQKEDGVQETPVTERKKGASISKKMRKQIRKQIRKAFSHKRYEKMVRQYGTVKAKLFYR